MLSNLTLVQSLLSSPVVIAGGILLVVVLLFVPLALKVAGLSGEQILELLKLVAQDIVFLVKMFQDKNDVDKPQK